MDDEHRGDMTGDWRTGAIGGIVGTCILMAIDFFLLGKKSVLLTISNLYLQSFNGFMSAFGVG